jgi:sec-independent protein translocase protein TatB
MGVDMLFILLLALILFGPKRLPHIAREVGKFVAEFKRASNDFKSQLQAEIDKAATESPAQRPQPTLAPSGVQQTETLTQTILPPTSAIPPALAAEAHSEGSPALDAEHERRMRYARMAFEAQNFTMRPPQPPPVPAAAPQSPPAPVPTATAPAAADPMPGAITSSPAPENVAAHATEPQSSATSAGQES